MRIIYIPLLVIIFLSFISSVFAQTPDDAGVTKNDKTSSFKIGVNYLNNNVLFGRSDTVGTPTILPQVKYTLKNGMYFSGSLDIIPNRTQNKLDGGSLAAGYDFDITDNLGGGVSFTKLFYNPNSTQIGSSISSTISATLDYDIAGIITPTIGADYDFIRQGFGNDIFVNAGISHDFAKKGIFGDGDLFIISPSVTVNTGTQNFYDAYLILKKYKLTAKGQAREAAAEKLLTTQKEKLSKYNLLDYEFSAPVEYKLGILILSFIPIYAVAENKLPPRITAGMVNKQGIFYFEGGASLKF